MKTVGIIGAGWLGLPLGKRLVEKGVSVWGTTTRETKFPELNAAGIKPLLFHFQSGAPIEFPSADLWVITIPPRGGAECYGKLMSSLRDSAISSGIRNLIFCSSTSVYPEANRIVTEGDAESIPSKHSGVRLFDIEEIFRTAPALNPTILRLAGLYGPGRQPGRFLAGKKDLSGAENPVNMVHQEDVVAVMLSTIEQAQFGKTWNVVGPTHPTRKEFYTQAAQKGEFELPEWSQATKPWKEVSGAKIARELGYAFLH